MTLAIAEALLESYPAMTDLGKNAIHDDGETHQGVPPSSFADQHRYPAAAPYIHCNEHRANDF